MCIWANTKWGSYIGVFEMCDHHFLFEFPTKIMAEHTLTGDWSGKRKHYICHGGLWHLLGEKKMMKEIKKDAEGESKTKKLSSKIISDVLT
ncbi:hypothetical protein H5410_029894 [Solanum commersonii]|uniref:Uncharacterized protein n=1 Tax=Solanum commersonii TaxID=4109 RepID=A0A9J5YH16_SOLCO|nr:hypothetical protein H5410_029894 [Solanum commersonii]